MPIENIKMMAAYYDDVNKIKRQERSNKKKAKTNQLWGSIGKILGTVIGAATNPFIGGAIGAAAEGLPELLNPEKKYKTEHFLNETVKDLNQDVKDRYSAGSILTETAVGGLSSYLGAKSLGEGIFGKEGYMSDAFKEGTFADKWNWATDKGAREVLNKTAKEGITNKLAESTNKKISEIVIPSMVDTNKSVNMYDKMNIPLKTVGDVEKLPPFELKTVGAVEKLPFELNNMGSTKISPLDKFQPLTNEKYKMPDKEIRKVTNNIKKLLWHDKNIPSEITNYLSSDALLRLSSSNQFDNDLRYELMKEIDKAYKVKEMPGSGYEEMNAILRKLDKYISSY